MKSIHPSYNRVSPYDDLELHPIDRYERDACALICAVRKGGQPTHGNVKRTIEALARMGHRSGSVNGEGDGVGILTDIPRQLWSKWLAQAGLRSSLAADRNFWVAHVMIPSSYRPRAPHLIEHISRQMSEAGLHILLDRHGTVNRQVLGPNAEKNEPVFYQIAGINGQVASEKLDRMLFDLQVSLEKDLGIHFASLSAHSVVYKVQGSVEILRRYYPELRDPDYASTITMGHARYSTNTNPIFERAQPFGLLGHNGEFNTISRFRIEAEMLGIELNPTNSDSQDVDRVLHALCMHYDLDLIEAMEFVFPPYPHDLIQNNDDIQNIYAEMRQAFGPFAQGPAAVAARLGNIAVFSVDALGLRPLWFGETEKEYFASSERGVYPLDMMSVSPKPMAPGEKIALIIKPGYTIELLNYPDIQHHVVNKYRDRRPAMDVNSYRSKWPTNQLSGTSGSYSGEFIPERASIIGERRGEIAIAELEPTLEIIATPLPWQEQIVKLNTTTLAALGWERLHTSLVEDLAERQKEQIGSLGWDGPLAALSHTRVNIADYFKETVAVVTNPAIDRERENAQFSTQTIVGVRPAIGVMPNMNGRFVELKTPILAGGHPDLGNEFVIQQVAEKLGTMTLEQLIAYFDTEARVLSLYIMPDESYEAAIERLQKVAIEWVRDGISLLVLDDTLSLDGNLLWIDPLLAVAAIDRALRQYPEEPNLRRQTGIVVRSGALRDLHDLALCISLGANAVVPYALYGVAVGIAPKGSKDLPDDDTTERTITNTIIALTHGLQKITSTIGCHDLRGYGHSFSAIGLSKGIAAVFGTPNYFGSEGRGATWTRLRADAEKRAAELRGESRAKLANPDRLYPKMWKKAEAIATGDITLDEYTEMMRALESEMPVEIRHILGFKESAKPLNPSEVDIKIGDHDMPILISAMSFGSQGELAYRAYAEAAYRLNIICINGEGGELPDLMGKYYRNRGQQVASARFGVNIDFLNSVNLIEIKIGQGAKPGEGGQLPGIKVTEQVAAARHTTPGVTLISPSNNHDLYSIEDLAQLIDELKTANPLARVSVKIPVVPGVGIIAVGVAKAGADIITITGYSGGTGAARVHSLRHVGLPTEIGLWLAHRALTESGLRDSVELWADGGMKSGRDAVKMMLLGANRVGFGTMAMVAMGCTICRGCHEGTCHVGITTHIKTIEEATHKGLKSFVPRQYESAVQGICNVLSVIGEDIRRCVAMLGFQRAQDLVGRADLLEQISMFDQIDLTHLTRPVPPAQKKPAQPGGTRLSRPRNIISKQITSLVADYVKRGDYELTYDDEQVMAMDRALGTHLAGALKRGEIPFSDRIEAITLSFSNSALPGNGLAAFLDTPLNVIAEGGAQDGVAKCAKGGRVTILKGLNHNGERLDGSVGKSFAYGAQGGLFIVQGDADSRACIRLSGADVIFGGEVKIPLRDQLGGIGARANLKGYAFEYMTSGRALVLGDPGPWMCAGMTGGVIYQRLQPEMKLDIPAIERRIAKGSIVTIMPLDEKGVDDVRELLNIYIETLEMNNQPEAVEHLYALLKRPQDHFVKIAPPALVN